MAVAEQGSFHRLVFAWVGDVTSWRRELVHPWVDSANWPRMFCRMASITLKTLPYRDNLRMAEIVHEGLPMLTLREVAKSFGISPSKLSTFVRIPPRTLARRRQERLKADESERVLRVGRLLRLAEDVFEDRDAAVKWFMRPLQSLGGNSPLQLCSTEFGAREVEQALGRIEHGVFS
jgi:putative toxin-antitoxin system antitoxin component (TIGR02293 family)